jgi:hypothetical protein
MRLFAEEKTLTAEQLQQTEGVGGDQSSLVVSE